MGRRGRGWRGRAAWPRSTCLRRRVTWCRTLTSSPPPVPGEWCCVGGASATQVSWRGLGKGRGGWGRVEGGRDECCFCDDSEKCCFGGVHAKDVGWRAVCKSAGLSADGWLSWAVGVERTRGAGVDIEVSHEGLLSRTLWMHLCRHVWSSCDGACDSTCCDTCGGILFGVCVVSRVVGLL